MSDHTSDDHEHDHGHGHGDHGDEEAERVTSPMQSFTTTQVGLGTAVAVVGLLVVFGVPLLLV
jgi:hypothetical protein